MEQLVIKIHRKSLPGRVNARPSRLFSSYSSYRHFCFNQQLRTFRFSRDRPRVSNEVKGVRVETKFGKKGKEDQRGSRKDWKVSKTLRRVDARSISTRFRDNSRLEDGGIDRGSKRRRGLSKASRSTITLIYIWRGGERISMPGRKSIGFPFVRSPVRRINPGVVCCFTQVGRNLQ